MFDKIIENHYEVGPKCKHFRIDVNPTQSESNVKEVDFIKYYSSYIPKEATLGDMIVVGKKTVRSSNVYFVNYTLTKNETTEKLTIIKTLVQKPSSGGLSGQCCVPLEVTCKIKDPVSFYEQAFTFDNYDEIDFTGLEIDTTFHQDLLRQFTNGRAVDVTRKCFYFLSCNDWDSTGGMFIWCDFFLDDFDLGRYVRLTPDINDQYLTERPTRCRHPDIVTSSIEMRHKYEHSFTDTFHLMTKEDDVDVFGSAFFCPLDNDCHILTMSFNRIELDNSREGESPDKEDNPAIKTVILNAKCENVHEEFRFTKRVLTEYGRFGGVQLWTMNGAMPLIDENNSESSIADNTYVICSVDLFL